MKIIYQNESSGVSVIHPTGELSIEEVAAKDVPEGVPYIFVPTDDVPSDRTFRDAWEADFSNPDGYGIGADAYFAAKEAEAEAAVVDVEPTEEEIPDEEEAQ